MSERPKRNRSLDRPSIQLSCNGQRIPQVVGFGSAQYDLDHKKLWEKKEIKDAEDFGGRRVSGSGNKRFKPGDVKTEFFLIENKTTDHSSFSITHKLWEKIYHSAILSQRVPLLSIKLNQTNTELVVISKSDLLLLLEKSLG